MRTTRRLALVVVAAAAAATLSVPASLTPHRARLLPSAAAAELTGFGDCEQLRQWYVDAALPQVGPWGFDAPVWAAAQLGGDAAADTATRAVASSPTRAWVSASDTGTNVQEAGVDEPDVAKADGRLLVRVAGRHLLVLDVTGREPRRLARLRLPGPWLDSRELLLVGDSVLVVGQESGGRRWGPVVDRAVRTVRPGSPAVRTHLVHVDVSDPGSPRVLSHQRVDGGLVGAREYGDGTTRVVVGTGLPVLDFVRPTRTRSRAEARRENRAIVRAAPVEAWLPGLRQGDGRGRHPLLDCAAVLHPGRPAGFGTLSVLTLPTQDPRSLTATAVLAAGELTYSSADRLYVATIDRAWWDVVPLTGTAPGRRGARAPRAPSTQVHAFALDGAATTYIASGRVPGTVRDRWSLSEHDGVLRVASALGRGWDPRENAVHVLTEDGDRLRVAGRVDGLGRGERIQSVRWLGDVAVVVTFRQVDPLYTLDLADPARPRLLGALKIPGFSAYLHPLGDGLLLGLGEDADRRGVSRGGQAAVFDLADLRDVVRTDTLGLDRADRFATAWEPRAFTYLPDRRTVLVPVESWARGGVRVLALRVDDDGGLTRTAAWRLGRWGGAEVRALPLGDDRVALVHRGVRVVDLDRAR